MTPYGRRWDDRIVLTPEPPADGLGAFISAIAGCLVGALVILLLEALL